MPAKQAPIVIVGDGEFAEIACDYFTHDSPFRVAGFAVERDFLRRDTLFDLPSAGGDYVLLRRPWGARSSSVGPPPRRLRAAP